MLRTLCCQANLWILRTYEYQAWGVGSGNFTAQSVGPVRTATNHSPRTTPFDHPSETPLRGPRTASGSVPSFPRSPPPPRHMPAVSVPRLHRQRHLVPHARLREPVERHPEALLHLVVRAERGAARQREHE